MGFNAGEMLPITVDPDIPGATYVLEPGSVKPQEDAPPPRVPAGGYNREVVRKIADAEMRKAVQGAPAMSEKEEPMAKKKTTRKAPTRKKAAAAPPPEPEEYEPEPVEHEVPALPPMPEKVIAFDFGPPMGTMESRYHDIFREGNRLVLVWDTACTTASKYVPARMPGTPMRVIVGREREEYQVFSLGMEFTDETTGRFYVVLLIDLREDHDG